MEAGLNILLSNVSKLYSTFELEYVRSKTTTTTTSLLHLPLLLLFFFLTSFLPYTHAQSRPLLPLNRVSSFTSSRLSPASRSFAIPKQDADGEYGVSVALCSSESSANVDKNTNLRFFVTNASNWDTQDDPGPSSPGFQDTWEIELKDGVGSWRGMFPNGGVLAVEGDEDGVDFDVGVAEGDPIHQTLDALPLLGDTTSNQALIFSAPFLALPDNTDLNRRPTYPNYTLPAANMSQPPLPAGVSPPNMTLLITVTNPNNVELRTGCALLTREDSVGTIASETVWARGDALGWRMQWVVEGLTPSTNYTAYVVVDETKVSGPVYFATKSAAFTCPLVHSLPYCPSISYAVPLPPPSNGDTYTDAASTLPSTLTTPLLSYFANFTAVLTTHACGRDWYSPVVGCDDCERAYRAWLCAVSFVRCGEEPASGASLAEGASGPQKRQSQQQKPLTIPTPPRPALQSIPPSSTPRNPFLPVLQTGYTALLPCVEQCYAADRACPPFVGFRCPGVVEFGTTTVGAKASYGVGYLDGEDGEEGAGATRVAQDRWGNVWCNYV
ncbi:Stretch-activated cation channel MID1 [Psilocybe cubensis]|uniref:Stretch-activated cation channel MID1 n=1 Tax=Psilocybe cubensis TaxID=181762 RepID=A0ACB8GKM3_PSICU|nr:Stretch-activated cation channel MID1 [Psilocybe cubensis]KAH9476226.1 Stretch-activated cation channel MID1 [Psilocybe cubensis]